MATAEACYEERQNRLQHLLAERNYAAILITRPVNISYLTGFTGDSSYLLVDRQQAVLLSDSRFTDQLEKECAGLTLEIRGPSMSMPELVEKVIGQSKLSQVALEANHVTLAMRRGFADRLSKVELVESQGLVESMRIIKDDAEVAAIRNAIRVAEQAIQEVTSNLTADPSESDIAREIEYTIRRYGGTGCSFDSIVAVGDHSALPHAPRTDRRLGDADFVLIDWGARCGQYVSDLTRIFVTGRISPKLESIYGLVANAQEAAIGAIRPGVTAEEVDAAARSVLAEAGHGEHFGHGLGHGIGLEVHEAPRIAGKQSQVLAPGMVITVEPGVYLPGWGGVRIEDDVLITREGHEVLSAFTKNLDDCVLCLN